MKVYAEVSLNGEPQTRIRTTVDMAGETNPKWDLQLNYAINKVSLHEPGLVVVVKLYCQRTLGDKYIGQVKIPVMGLLDSRRDEAEIEASFDVDGTKNGKLNISYTFVEMLNKHDHDKPSRWKKKLKVRLKVGFLVMVQGTCFVLTGGTI
ncbi:protein SRC2 homolog [Salvia hispanica]|uniref:protein SRC2 homolog n=1 Tax=Salvia hispanica TaxID=49212 RepID=UPI002009992B|nr:protein SRC2 homolog [Salvia hispanica]XP_047962305.1 protein SRC2 homolog [Salvia hispanica]